MSKFTKNCTELVRKNDEKKLKHTSNNCVFYYRAIILHENSVEHIGNRNSVFQKAALMAI